MYRPSNYRYPLQNLQPRQHTSTLNQIPFINALFAQHDQQPIANRQQDLNASQTVDAAVNTSVNTSSENGKCVRLRKAKPFFELKATQRRDRKRKYESVFKEPAKYIHDDVKSIKVQLEFGNGQTLSFFPRQKDKENENGTIENETQNASKDLRIIQQVLSIKDKYRISDEALHELHMLGTMIPSKNNIVAEKMRLNTTLEIFSHPTADCASRKLENVLELVLKHEKYHSFIQNGTVTLRFSCDGAKIAKNINSVRGVFKILKPRNSLPLNLDELSMSPEDEFTLFFFIGDESRENLEKYGKETFQDMRRIQSTGILINRQKISVKWCLTCDWKALALLRGISGAHCDFFCVWCHCSKRQICDFSIPSWQIKRSTTEQTAFLQEKRYGYKDTDLCSFIEYKDMPIDDLHLRMRISMKLFNQVVTWCLDQKSEENLQTELKKIGVTFKIWEERGDDKMNTKVRKWSQPTGDDLRIIVRDLQLHRVLDDRQNRRFVSIDSLSINQLKEELGQRGLSKKGKKCELVAKLKEVIGNNTRVKKNSSSRLQVSYDFSDDEDQGLDVQALQQIWAQFHDLMESLRALPGTVKYKDSEVFMQEAKEWATEFRKQTFDEDVIPYIHAMVYHVPQFLVSYRCIHDIGVSQVERKNFDHRQAYFGCTNRNGGHRKKHVSKQILERENRMLWVSLHEIDRKRRKYVKTQNLTSS